MFFPRRSNPRTCGFSFSRESAGGDTLVPTDNATPDILICLNATNTICAYQAVVDHNKVGEIQILGYYDSDEILTAVEKRIIQATVAVDANRVGATCVDALMEYLHFDRTSDFTPVSLTVVTANNVRNTGSWPPQSRRANESIKRYTRQIR